MFLALLEPAPQGTNRNPSLDVNLFANVRQVNVRLELARIKRSPNLHQFSTQAFAQPREERPR
jgi:hypothetical protein